jgi:hypothetical protein
MKRLNSSSLGQQGAAAGAPVPNRRTSTSSGKAVPTTATTATIVRRHREDEFPRYDDKYWSALLHNDYADEDNPRHISAAHKKKKHLGYSQTALAKASKLALKQRHRVQGYAGSNDNEEEAEEDEQAAGDGIADLSENFTVEFEAWSQYRNMDFGEPVMSKPFFICGTEWQMQICPRGFDDHFLDPKDLSSAYFASKFMPPPSSSSSKLPNIHINTSPNTPTKATSGKSSRAKENNNNSARDNRNGNNNNKNISESSKDDEPDKDEIMVSCHLKHCGTTPVRCAYTLTLVHFTKPEKNVMWTDEEGVINFGAVDSGHDIWGTEEFFPLSLLTSDGLGYLREDTLRISVCMEIYGDVHIDSHPLTKAIANTSAELSDLKALAVSELSLITKTLPGKNSLKAGEEFKYQDKIVRGRILPSSAHSTLHGHGHGHGHSTPMLHTTASAGMLSTTVHNKMYKHSLL